MHQPAGTRRLPAQFRRGHDPRRGGGRDLNPPVWPARQIPSSGGYGQNSRVGTAQDRQIDDWGNLYLIGIVPISLVFLYIQYMSLQFQRTGRGLLGFTKPTV